MKKHNLKAEFLLEPIDCVESEITFDLNCAQTYCRCILLRQIKKVSLNRKTTYSVYNLSKSHIVVQEIKGSKFVCNVFEAIKKAVEIINIYRTTGEIK